MKQFFFYDLETSGLNPRDDRIMQFAGIRTDMNFQPIGEPYNLLVKLTDDILPSPDAIMVTGITPQMTSMEGLSEPEFAKLLNNEIFLPDTITVGFNNVSFDDEFIRHTLWRNFYDPYEWAWSGGRSRWDLLDVVRLTRALRPEGINWPADESGKPVNKLELLTKVNGLNHEKAHDALSDVEALIAISKLIKEKQPKLFDYLLGLRDKKKVAEVVNLEDPKPFVYADGRYSSDYQKTTVAFPIAPGTKPGSVLVYDLRQDPSVFLSASPKALYAVLTADKEMRQQPDFTSLPVKELSYNKCPAVSPLGVLDGESQDRLSLNMQTIEDNLKTLVSNPTFGSAVREAFEMRPAYESKDDVEHKLYDSFSNDKDKALLTRIRQSGANELSDFNPNFIDERLSELLFRYKARHYPESLSEEEHISWQQYRATKLNTNLAPYLKALQRLANKGADSFLLEELQLWAESIMPESD